MIATTGPGTLLAQRGLLPTRRRRPPSRRRTSRPPPIRTSGFENCLPHLLDRGVPLVPGEEQGLDLRLLVVEVGEGGGLVESGHGGSRRPRRRRGWRVRASWSIAGARGAQTRRPSPRARESKVDDGRSRARRWPRARARRPRARPRGARSAAPGSWPRRGAARPTRVPVAVGEPGRGRPGTARGPRAGRRSGSPCSCSCSGSKPSLHVRSIGGAMPEPQRIAYLEDVPRLLNQRRTAPARPSTTEFSDPRLLRHSRGSRWWGRDCQSAKRPSRR